MPWFPDFVGAVELARRDTQLAGRGDPVAQYLRALEQGDSHVLQSVWPGRIVINDPLVGEVQRPQRFARLRQPKPNLVGGTPCTD